MQRIRYTFDGQGILAADGRAIATDLPTNPKSGADLRELVIRANSAPAMMAALKLLDDRFDAAALKGTRARPTVADLNAIWDAARAAIRQAEGRTNG